MRLAFLGFKEFDNGAAFRGAILVTDEWGKPMEFRCTAPVKPNVVQRTLYGKTLMPHILVELIGGPLYHSIQEKPEILMVDTDHFLDLRLKPAAIPILQLRRQGAKINLKSDDNKNKNPSTVMESESGKFDTVVVEGHWQFPNDGADCQKRLQELFGKWDLIEPFDRLTRGLEYVHQQNAVSS